MAQHSFSFIVACYNSDQFIEECLRSLVNQDYDKKLFEIVVIDDGSEDRSPQIIQSFKEKYTNVVTIRTGNSGLEKACNCGLFLAKNDRVVRVDADDFLPADYLKSMNEAMQANPQADFYYCQNYIEYYAADKSYAKSFPAFDAEEIFERGDFFATGTVYKMKDLNELGGFPEEIKNCGLENYTVILKLLSRGKKGMPVQQASFCYRRHGGNMSTLKRGAIIDFGHKLLKRFGRVFKTNKNHPYGLSVSTGIIVQARMTSTRLPGKVLKEVMGKPLLEYQLERLKKAQNAQQVIVATTMNASDDAIVALCQKLEVKFFRGSEEDVLSRYYGAAKEAALKTVVRVTSDCPLIDPSIIDQVIQAYTDEKDKDYVSNNVTRSYPRGMDTEVFSFKALETSFNEAAEKAEREHVTPFLYKNPGRFKIGQVVSPVNLSKHRWTVDTDKDFELIRNFLEALYPVNPDFTMQDCLNLLEEHPDWFDINAAVKQKAYGE